MEIVLDIFNDLEFREFLLNQDGIYDVNVVSDNALSKFDISCKDGVTSYILYKYIELFKGNDIPLMVSFDKNYKTGFKTIKYVVDDLCCEFCYKGFVTDLFLNDNVFSVKSNSHFDDSLFDVEFYIEYNEMYDEQDLIKYIKDKLNND